MEKKTEDERENEEREMKEHFFFQKMFQDPQTRQMNQPNMFHQKKKKPFRTNYSSIFLRKFRILTCFQLFT